MDDPLQPPWPVVVSILTALGKSASVEKLSPWGGFQPPESSNTSILGCWPLRYTMCVVSSRQQKFVATGLCLLRFQEPLFRLSSVVPTEGMCEERPLTKIQQILFGNPAFGEPLSCVWSWFGGASRWIIRKVTDHTEGLVASAVVIAWKTFALSLQRYLSVSHRFSHRDLAKPTDCDRCGKCTLTTMLEKCDWADLQGLVASGHHEGMNIARERYERFQVSRSPGKEVVRTLQTKTLED